MRKTAVFIGVLMTLLVSCSATGRKGWKLVWQDEFSKDGRPDTKKWTINEKRPGFYNGEAQAYVDRPENARVEGGNLIIEARKDGYGGFRYTSARMDTFFSGKWTYGRIEVRAKLPRGRGTWPGIWLMPVENLNGAMGWPTSGEIDIMEHVGFDPENVHASIHCAAYNHPAGTHKTMKHAVEDPYETFHVYAVEWLPERIDFFVDEEMYFTFENEGTGYEVWPFYKDFYLILNLAIGGAWGGMQGIDESIFPTALVVDYVRVYEKIQ
jgi:beta-glucanase (GH16 family)